MKPVLTFPGQGSQAVGMGRDLAETFAPARAVFDEVDEALGRKLSTLIFEGPIEDLTLTENAQPALMAVSMAALRVLEAEGLSLTDHISHVAGHSLGEYSALAAAGSVSVADTARLLRTRGQAMQQAVPVGEGAMAAILGLEPGAVADLASAAAGDEVCALANDNGGGQAVVSGHRAAVERVVELAPTKGAKRAILLSVSAPFHCSLMAPAAAVMEEALAGVRMTPPRVPLVANVTAVATDDPDMIRAQLVQQVTGMVRWRESIAGLGEAGVTLFGEIGAGRVLSGLARRIAPGTATQAVGKSDDIGPMMEKITASADSADEDS